ncbi:MAG: hypothetical protein IKH27_15345 [Oscillospiraceae bacterium]|nr:hypothetical protein [Oscillospiraceae bacterium]
MEIMMQTTKDEKERQYYNKKLIKEGVRNELKQPFRINWIELIANCIGIFIGLRIFHLAALETRITNGAVRILVQVLLIAACMTVTNLLANALLRKKQEQDG